MSSLHEAVSQTERQLERVVQTQRRLERSELRLARGGEVAALLTELSRRVSSACIVHVPRLSGEAVLDPASYALTGLARQCGGELAWAWRRWTLEGASFDEAQLRECLERGLDARPVWVGDIEVLRHTRAGEMRHPWGRVLYDVLDERHTLKVVSTDTSSSASPSLSYVPAWLREQTEAEELGGLFERLGGSASRLEEVCRVAKLRGVRAPEVIEQLGERPLHAFIEGALPSGFREVMMRFALNEGCAMSPDALRLSGDDEEVMEGLRALGLVDRFREEAQGSFVWHWTGGATWLGQVREAPSMRKRWCDELVGRAGEVDAPLDALELLLVAHRQACLGLYTEGMLETMRFGVFSIIEMARRLSLREEYEHAGALYQGILRDHASALTPRARGYCVHYLHYNRHRAGSELVRETLEGYRESLSSWPDNALFHARYISLLGEDGEGRAAMEALSRAYTSVPEHPERRDTLVSRPLEHLLRRGQRDVALALHLMYQARLSSRDSTWAETLRARDVERTMRRVLREGVQVQRLWSLDDLDASLVFLAPVQLCAVTTRDTQEVHMKLLDVQTGERELVSGPVAPDEVSAYVALHASMREQLEQDIRRQDIAALVSADRSRRVLMGLVDVHASRLSAGLPRSRWVRGEVDLQRRGVVLDEGGAFVPLDKEHLALFERGDVAWRRFKVRFESNHPEAPAQEVVEVEWMTHDEQEELLDGLFSSTEAAPRYKLRLKSWSGRGASAP